MDYIVTTTVFATTAVVGFHRWPDAPQEVDYLRHRHRHKFGIRAELSVVENDREVEFHILRRVVDAHMGLYFKVLDGIEDGYVEFDFGSTSCEAIAANILDYLRHSYPGRDLYRVTVDEDGENGATVEART